MSKRKEQRTFPLDVREWRGSLTIRGLSFFERGVLIELRLMMHAAARPGVLLLDGQKPTVPALASILSLSRAETDRVCRKLVASGLFDQEPLTGCVRDPAMVRRAELSEIRRRVGRRGGNPAITPWTRNPAELEIGQIRLHNQTDPQTGGFASVLDNQNAPVADYCIPVKERRGEKPPPMFDQEPKKPGVGASPPSDQVAAILAAYPTVQQDKPAAASVATALARGVDPVDLLIRVQVYADGVLRDQVADSYIPRASRWFDEERYLNQDAPPDDLYMPTKHQRDRGFQQLLASIRNARPHRREMRDAEAVRDFLLNGEAVQQCGEAETDKLFAYFKSNGLSPLAVLYRVRAELRAWRDDRVEPVAFRSSAS